MDRNEVLLALAFFAAFVSGCTGVETQELTPQEQQARDEQREERRKADQERKDSQRSMNELWRQGYGFGNDNAERIRQGLPPKNFDGTEGKYNPK